MGNTCVGRVVDSEASPADTPADPVSWDSLPEDVFKVIVDFAIRRSQEETPLHLACQDGNLGLVAFLVGVGRVDVEEKDSRGQTCLLKAVSRRDFATIHYLVHTAKVDLYASNKIGWTALHYPVGNSSDRDGDRRTVHMVQFLVEKCGIPIDTVTADDDGETILHMAAPRSDVTFLVTWLVSTGGAFVDAVDNFGYTALHLAAYAGKESNVNILLNHGASIEARTNQGETSLYLACQRGRTEFCRFLIESGHANVHAACPIGQGTLLHASMADLNVKHWSFDFKSKVAMIELLIEKGVDVCAVDGVHKETPLHLAANQMAPLEIVRALVQAGGARLVHAVRRPDKCTALHIAAQGGKLDVVKFLVKSGHYSNAFVHAVNSNGATAMKLAAASGRMDVVEYLTDVTRAEI